MKSSLECLKTMDWIDEVENLEISQPTLKIRNHLESCTDCRKYYSVSLGLNRLKTVKEKVDLYKSFAQPVSLAKVLLSWFKTPSFVWTAAIMLIVFLGGTLGLTFLGNSSKTQNIVRQNTGLSAQPVEYSLESSDLDNYYAISIDQ